MKVSPSFFQEETTRRLLERAVNSTITPLCVRGSNDWFITGWGKCAACKWVNAFPEGKEACRASREEYLEMVRMQETPIPFVCHMGFSCLITVALPGTNYMIFWGPYIHENAGKELEFAVGKGLMALGKLKKIGAPLPFTLEDIRTIPDDAMQASAEWLLDGLNALLNDPSREDTMDWEEDAQDDNTGEASHPRPDAYSGSRTNNPVEISIMALSLLCGRTKEPRAFLTDLIEEQESIPELMRSRIIRTVMEFLDAAKRQGGHVEAVWKTYAAFVEAANSLDGQDSLLKAAEKVLRKTARLCGDTFAQKYAYMPDVVEALHARHTSEKLLTETAETTGVALSTITRRLEIMTGATFSELLGRIRIIHARRLLRSSAMSSTDIAMTVGIHDQANFSKLFRRYSACTPGAYRARYRSK